MKGGENMASGDRSIVRDEKGRATAVDIDHGDETWRYSTYGPGSTTTRELIGVQDHETGESRECAGTDFFGNPVFKK